MAVLRNQAQREREAVELDHQSRGTGARDHPTSALLLLSYLAPDIVESILDGRQPKGLRLSEMLGNGPVAWEEQRVSWGL